MSAEATAGTVDVADAAPNGGGASRSAHLWRTAWAVPILIALHNAEEGLTLRPWLEQHGRALARALVRLHVVRASPSLLDPDRLSARYAAALVLATVVPLFIVVLAQLLRRRPALYVVVALQAVMFANVFSHVGAALVVRGYSPGLATAVFLNLPFSLYLFWLARREAGLEPRTLRVVVAAGIVAMAPLAALAVWAGGRMSMR
jgi:hypothetical protein